MSKKTINISVVTANHNNASYLNEFFNSIINSSVIPKELIIVDDGSIDNSVEIIETFLSYDFITLIKLDKNQGFANALNKGVQTSTGKFIVRIDPDDIIMPERLEKQFSFLNDNPDIDLVGGNVLYFNSETGRDISTSNFPLNQTKILEAYKSGDHGVQHPTVCVKAEVFKKYSYNQDTYPAEDYDIFARMINDGCKFANIADAVNRMRVHSKSVSNRISYNTIDKTFSLREEIFYVKSSNYQRERYFKYISNYRKFLFARNLVLKSLYIFVSALYYPEKVVRKIFSD